MNSSKSAAELRVALDEAIRDRDAAVPKDSADPALTRVGAALHRSMTAANDRALRVYSQRDHAVRVLRSQLARAEAAEKEAARRRLAFAEVFGARLVRDRYGWHEVVRVNRKSVTVVTGWSWTDRIPLDNVLEVKA